MECLDQIPQAQGNIDYTFAASLGGSDLYGKCFELTFTGTDHWETTLNHQKLKGKKLIVISSNIGYDVQGGQFDIMIQEGGVGVFNGCDTLLGNVNMGKQ